MLNIITVLKTGKLYYSDHVDKIFDMVRANITIPFKFYCFSDHKGNFSSNEIINIKTNPLLDYWWSKMQIFQMYGKCLYFDLDTIITDNIDDFIRNIYDLDNTFISVEDVYYKKRLQSSIMYWSGNFCFIYLDFLNNCDYYTNEEIFYKHNIRIKRPHSDQDAIEHILKKNDKTIKFFDKDSIFSFKKDLDFGKKFDKNKHKIVIFHGKPKPWQQNIIPY